MHCAQSHDNLTALLHRELSKAETDELQRHLAVCEGCRAEYQDLDSIIRSLRQNAPIEPSAFSRRNLQDHIDAVIAGRKKSATTTDRREEQAPRWRLVTPPPQPAIGYEPPKALPPGPESSAPRQLARSSPELAALPPPLMNRPASARLPLQPRATRFNGAAIWTICVVLLLSILVVSTALFKPLAPAPDAYHTQRLASGHRSDERNAAKAHGKLSETLINTQVQLGDAIGQSATLYLAPHADPRTGECCVVAYRSEDLEKLRNDPRIDQAAFEALIKPALQVTAADGKCTLPRQWVEAYLNSDPRVSVLNLDNRIEIWSSIAFEKYISGNGSFNPIAGTPPRNGLPPLK